MAEAVQFGQRWTYYSTHTMETMMEPTYFNLVKNQLKTGDDLRLLQLEENKVSCVSDVLIVNTDPLEFFTLREPTETEQPEYRVKRGYQCYKIVDSDGETIEEYPTKQDAEEALKLIEAA